MIGIIVTGHGNFATGLTSGLKLLAGDPELYEAVDFEPEDSIDTLTGKLKDAVARLDGCGSIAVFADLTGGSPFNVACRLKMEGIGKPMEVAGGTSLPVILQAYMGRMTTEDVESVVAEALEGGRGQLVRFVQTASAAGDEEDCECEEIEE